MNNLAGTYRNQDKHSDAEVLYKQCLAKEKAVLGESHPDTLNTMNNLADTYDHQGKYHQGKYGDAEALYKQCLDKQKAVLGESHPDTLATMNNLARVISKVKSQKA